MDLRTKFPRSMNVRMGGYAHLARMIDKCRATLAGTQGEYIYPCPMDERLLDYAGITADQFTKAVQNHERDEEVAAWFAHLGKAHGPDELEEWNRKLLLRGPSSSASMERFKKYRDAVDPSRTDLTAWSDLQDLEEGRPVPRREPTTD
jgi:hypothetical protein